MPTPATLPSNAPDPEPLVEPLAEPLAEALGAVLDADLAELTRQGLAVSGAASFLADLDRTFLQLAAKTALAAVQTLAAGPESLEQARQAGSDIDAADAARTDAVPRLAAITTCYEKAARAVRRAVALRAALANGRRFRPLPPPGTTPCPRPQNDPRPTRPHPADGTDSRDRPETGWEDQEDFRDELGAMTPRQAIATIARDITQAATGLHHLTQARPTQDATPATPVPGPDRNPDRNPDQPLGGFRGPYRPPPPRRTPTLEPDT